MSHTTHRAPRGTSYRNGALLTVWTDHHGNLRTFGDRAARRDSGSLTTVLAPLFGMILATAALVAVVLAVSVTTAPTSHGATAASSPTVRGPKLPCPSDEGSDGQGFPCVWDAEHMGNGHGRSFIVTPAGTLTYVSHRRAHALIVADAR